MLQMVLVFIEDRLEALINLGKLFELFMVAKLVIHSDESFVLQYFDLPIRLC